MVFFVNIIITCDYCSKENVQLILAIYHINLLWLIYFPIILVLAFNRTMTQKLTKQKCH